MRVLIIDRDAPLDGAALRTLHLRGYEVVTVGTEAEALELIHPAGFDCILVGVPESGVCEINGLGEFLQLARASAVAIMTATTAATFIDEAIAEGSIELTSAAALARKIGDLAQPALIVGARFDSALIRFLRDAALRFSVAGTLQFAMNLLVDGSRQVVLLETEIPGLTEGGRLAIFHQTQAKHLVILASALRGPSSGIVHSERPRKIGKFIELFEHIAGNRPSPCGRMEHWSVREAERG